MPPTRPESKRAVRRRVPKLPVRAWSVNDGARLVAVVVMALVLVWLNVQFNHWYNDFYNTIQTKNQPEFYRQLLKFTLLAFAYIIIYVYQIYLQQMLQKHEGNVAAAARASGLDRVHFYRLLWRHGLK